MLKKIISTILIIIILALWMPIEGLQEVLNSVAIEIEPWEYNYTGEMQTFTAPRKAIYQIELYGAQGYTFAANAVGGKGSYVKGNILLEKGETLNIYVGGQNGYNGGGKGTTTQGNGGGSTDVRYNGDSISSRIIVAAGGGGSYTITNYHIHTGSRSSGGGCYTKSIKKRVQTGTEYLRCPGYYNKTSDEDGNVYAECNVCGDKEGGDTTGRCYDYYNQPVYGYVHDYWEINCNKTEGVTIDSYTYINGKIEELSNNTEYQGSAGGGGGYYGGQTQYAGTNYANETYFTETSTQTGIQQGNGYAKITLLASPPEVELIADITENTNKDVVLTAIATDNIGFPSNPYSWNEQERTNINKYVATKNGTYTVDVINESEMTTEKSYTVNNIDKIIPKINSAPQLLSEDRKSTTITIKAMDYSSDDYIATGVTGYAITKENKQPSSFSNTNAITVSENGTYYAWAKDAVGNISEAREILVPDIEIEILGNITWNDVC